MIHNSTSFDPECFYAVGSNSEFVLVQLQDYKGEQVRIALTTDEAKHLKGLLQIHINKIQQTVDTPH